MTMIYVDMRLPVNPRSLTVLSGSSSLQAGGHMGTALDHADIRGFRPHISVGPGSDSYYARACSSRLVTMRWPVPPYVGAAGSFPP